MTRAMLIINPVAGQGKGKRIAHRFESQLSTMFDQVVFCLTEKQGDATHFAARACDEQFDAVFAVGGDGTVSECLNGMGEKDYRPTFGFLPGGTINTTARELEIPLNLDRAVDSFPRWKQIRLDIGKVNDHFFISSIAIGRLPSATQQVSTEQKEKFGVWAYVREELGAMNESDAYPLVIELEEEKIDLKTPLAVISTGHVLGGIRDFVPNATLKDGKVYLLALKQISLLANLAVASKALTGNLPKDDRILYREFERGTISVHGQEKIYSNVDGDKGPALPLNITCLRDHLTFYVPKNYEQKISEK